MILPYTVVLNIAHLNFAQQVASMYHYVHALSSPFFLGGGGGGGGALIKLHEVTYFSVSLTFINIILVV